MQRTFISCFQITFEWERHWKLTFSKSMWKSSSVKESICINYLPSTLQFSLPKNFCPRFILSSYQSHSIYLANTLKSSIVFCGRKNLCHLISKGTVAEFTRRARGLPGAFLLSLFSRNLLLHTSNTAVSFFKIQLQISITNKNQYIINKDMVHHLSQFTWI